MNYDNLFFSDVNHRIKRMDANQIGQVGLDNALHPDVNPLTKEVAKAMLSVVSVCLSTGMGSLYMDPGIVGTREQGNLFINGKDAAGVMETMNS